MQVLEGSDAEIRAISPQWPLGARFSEEHQGHTEGE